MVDENGFLQDDDAMSRISEGGQDDLEYLDPHQGLEDDLYMSKSDTSTASDDEDEEEDQFDTNPGGVDETLSPTQAPGCQGAPEVGPTGTPGPATKMSGRKRKATEDIMEVFAGPSKKRDPSHVKLCLLYTSPSPRDGLLSRMPSSA